MSKPSPRAFFAAVRPAEWALLAFALYANGFVAWRTGGQALAAMSVLLYTRVKHVFVALLIVSVVQLAVELWRERRPVPEALRRPLQLTFGLAVLPLVLAAWFQAVTFDRADWVGAKADDQLHLVMMVLLRVLGVGSPLLGVWLAVARLARAQGHLDGAAGQLARRAGALLREYFPVLLFIPAYSWMEDVIGQPARDYDGLLQAIDRALFLGHEPVRLLERVVSGPLSDWLAFSYSFYAVLYPLAFGAALLGGGQRGLREGVTAMSLGLAVTYVGYSLLPVKGPALSMTFSVPLDVYYVREVKEMLMDRARITYDCFPSFHTAGSLLMAWMCFRHARGVFYVALPMVASIPLACVYLRYHYVTDVLAGVALFLVLRWAVPRLLRRYPVPEPG